MSNALTDAHLDPIAGDTPTAPEFDGFIRVPSESLLLTRLLPLTAGTPQVGAEKAGSVAQLVAHWRADDLGVRFAQLVQLPGVTLPNQPEPIRVASFMKALRADALSPGGRSEVADALRRLGAALARYHLDGSGPADWSGAVLAERLADLGGRLGAMGWPRSAQAMLDAALPAIAQATGESMRTATLKGLDVQNVLSYADSRLMLLDPGTIRTGWREADIARFLVSCRLALWGTLPFPLATSYVGRQAASFLRGYYGDEMPSPLLAMCCAAETLETWRKAYGTLAIKSWPMPVKRAVKRFYVDPAFRRFLAADLTATRS